MHITTVRGVGTKHENLTYEIFCVRNICELRYHDTIVVYSDTFANDNTIKYCNCQPPCSLHWCHMIHGTCEYRVLCCVRYKYVQM